MIKAKESSPGGEIMLMGLSLQGCGASFQPGREGMPGAHSNLILTCPIWTIFYFTESEAISQNTCFRERLPDLSGIGQFHRTFQSGNRFVLLMEKLMKTSSPKKELAVSRHVRPSSAESLFFHWQVGKEKSFYYWERKMHFITPIICEYKPLPEWKHEKLITIKGRRGKS